MVANLILRHIYKIRFSFFSHFVRIWLQNLYKVLIWSKKFYLKNAIWYQKTQNMMLVLNLFKKLQKDSCEKSYQRTSDRKMEFLTFITVFTSFRPITSFRWNFLHFFNGLELSFNEQFSITLSQTRTKRLKVFLRYRQGYEAGPFHLLKNNLYLSMYVRECAFLVSHFCWKMC